MLPLAASYTDFKEYPGEKSHESGIIELCGLK